MDYGDLLSRAWRVVWHNKYLFVLGFLAALGSASGMGSNNVSYTFGGDELPPNFDVRVEQFWNDFWPYLAGLACLAILVVIALWLIRLTAQAGLIGAVDRIEAGEKVSFGEAISSGASKLGRMVGINAIMYGPFFLLGMLAAAVTVALVASAVDFAFNDFTNVGEGVLGSLGIILACIGVLFCLLLPVLLVVTVIYPFAQRAAVLEDLPVTTSIKRGWGMVSGNLGDVVLLVVIFIALGIAFGMVAALILFPLSFILFFPWIINTVDQGTFNFGSILMMSAGGICMGLIVAALNSVLIAFRSATVTLAYRHFIGKIDAPKEVTAG